MAASEQMPRDAVKTIIGDREADIFELFSRIPTDNVHLLIRSVHERNCRLDDPDCSVHLNTLMEQAFYGQSIALKCSREADVRNG